MVIRSIAGLFAFALIAWVISENRRKVDLRVVATGLVLQVQTGMVTIAGTGILKTGPYRISFDINRIITGNRYNEFKRYRL